MRSRPWSQVKSAFGLLLLLPALACMGYARRDTPVVIPTAENVRIPFKDAQRLLIWYDAELGEHDSLPTSAPVTLDRVTAVVGRVLQRRGDTLVVAPTHVTSAGKLVQLPRDHTAITVIDRRQTEPIEQWGQQQAQTIALAVTVTVVVALAVAVLAFALAMQAGTGM